MSGDAETAWIAAGASLVVSLITAAGAAIQAWRTQRAQDEAAAQLAKLQSRLSDKNDAAKARRDYEYEARKRLYTELYPLAYQLQQAALHAQHRIKNLALAARGGWLADGEDNWLTGRDTYYFTVLVYSLIAPLALHELITRKLTQLDLALDQDLSRLHVIAYRAYEAMRSDFNFLDPCYPPIDFGPGVKGYNPPEDRAAAHAFRPGTAVEMETGPLFRTDRPGRRGADDHPRGHDARDDICRVRPRSRLRRSAKAGPRGRQCRCNETRAAAGRGIVSRVSPCAPSRHVAHPPGAGRLLPRHSRRAERQGDA